MKIRPLILLLGPTFGFALHCADLSPIAQNTCGNGVIEVAEACDGKAPVEGQKVTCLDPSEGPGRACEIDCSSAACPTGWGCDTLTNVCQAPSGKFAATGRSAPASARRVFVDDFDGDGSMDALTRSATSATDRTSRARVHYFDRAGGVAESLLLRRPVVNPTPVHLSSARFADILLGSDGLAVLRGHEERTIEPVALPFLRGLRAEGPSTGEAQVAIVTGFVRRVLGNQTDLSQQFFALAGPQGSIFHTLEGEVAALKQVDATLGYGGLRSSPSSLVFAMGSHGDPLRLRTENLLDGSCGDLAVGGRNQRAVTVFAPCEEPPRPAVELVSPFPLERLFASDLNGDGIDELIFAGANTFQARQAPFTPPSLQPAIDEFRLLAIGDVNADGYPDLVGISTKFDLSVIRLATPPALPGQFPTYSTVNAFARGDRWGAAVIADINGDGVADVIASRTDARNPLPDLDILISSKLGAFSPTVHPTDGAVTQLITEDVDADGSPDIVFGEATAGGKTAVRILFGSRSGLSDDETTIGTFATVNSIVDLGWGALGKANDRLRGEVPKVGVVSGASLYVALGGPDRLVFSQLLPGDSAVAQDVGAFRLVDPDPTKPATTALCGVFVPAAPVTGVIVGATPPDPQFRCAGSTTGLDGYSSLGAGTAFLDPSAVDRKAVYVSTTYKPSAGSDQRFVLSQGASGGKITAGRPDEKTKKIAFEDLGAVGGPITNDTPFDVRDLDGDSLPDALAVRGIGAQAEVVVMWGTGKAFAAPQVIGAGVAFSFAKVASGGGAPSLAVLSPDKQVVGYQLEQGRSWTKKLLASLATDADGGVAAGAAVGKPFDLAAGDINGDGLDDLVIIDGSGTIRTYLQLERRSAR